MKNRLNYSELMANWMQLYEMSAEMSKKVWTSILTHLRNQKSKTTEKEESTNEEHLERADRKG